MERRLPQSPGHTASAALGLLRRSLRDGASVPLIQEGQLVNAEGTTELEKSPGTSDLAESPRHSPSASLPPRPPDGYTEKSGQLHSGDLADVTKPALPPRSRTMFAFTVAQGKKGNPRLMKPHCHQHTLTLNGSEHQANPRLKERLQNSWPAIFTNVKAVSPN